MDKTKINGISPDVHEALVLYFNKINAINVFSSGTHNLDLCIQNKRKLILWQLHETENLDQHFADSNNNP